MNELSYASLQYIKILHFKMGGGDSPSDYNVTDRKNNPFLDSKTATVKNIAKG